MPDPAERLPWEAKFVENMAQRRRELGMTQATLARIVSARGPAFHQQTVQRIENGERPVRLNEAVLIVQALGLGDEAELGLDAAIQPELDLETATWLLSEAQERMRRMAATTDERLADAVGWAVGALAQLRSAAEAYERSGGPEGALLREVRRRVEVYEQYLAALGSARLPPEER